MSIIKGVGVAVAVLAFAGGCATRSGSPQPAVGATRLTAAKIGTRYERVLVAEKGAIAMVARDGCVATVAAGMDATGDYEEIRVRCPKPERLKAWFVGVDRITANVPVDAVEDDNEEDMTLPAAELVTKKGDVMKVRARADAESLLGEVRALSAELASAEMPSPGPNSARGWQMLRVSGPARVLLGGSPAIGMLEARLSTSGQYLCEFIANKSGSPVRATKGGWIAPAIASRAIDEVLNPFAEIASADRKPTTFAAGTSNGAERRATPESTKEVFDRFAHVQDALGDACLPELEAPAAQQAPNGRSL
jgi:hypothetical protein